MSTEVPKHDHAPKFFTQNFKLRDESTQYITSLIFALPISLFLLTLFLTLFLPFAPDYLSYKVLGFIIIMTFNILFLLSVYFTFQFKAAKHINLFNDRRMPL
jgi:amino acid transporter